MLKGIWAEKKSQLSGFFFFFFLQDHFNFGLSLQGMEVDSSGIQGMAIHWVMITQHPNHGHNRFVIYIVAEHHWKRVK